MTTFFIAIGIVGAWWWHRRSKGKVESFGTFLEKVGTSVGEGIKTTVNNFKERDKK